MSRALTNKLYRNFTKGLITEASPLTYPENSCIELDNCLLYRKGNISRRLGANFEDGFNYSPHTIPTADFNKHALKEFMWETVGNDTTKNFLVKQIGSDLYFYDMSLTALSTGIKSFALSMNSYRVSGVTEATADLSELSFTSGKGFLFVVGENYEPTYVTYNAVTDTVTQTRIYVQIRDFLGVNDLLGNDEEPATLSALHEYNLMNQGWVDPEKANATGYTVQYFNPFGGIGSMVKPTTTPISEYFVHANRYPGNNKQWWVAKKAADNKFDPALLRTFYFGSGRAPRGHFIINAFTKDRAAVSGVTAVPSEPIAQRPLSVAFAAGRVFYGCQSTVFYSQLLDTKDKVGFCYQEADPTAETISDLIATDGGEIPIPEMGKALKLVSINGGVLIFANNGIWFIQGGQGGFSALDFSIQKVSPIGTISPNSVVATKEGIFWFSKVGIQGLQITNSGGGAVFNITTISEDTIQTYCNDIPEAVRPYIKGIYDPATNIVQWLINSVNDGYNYLYNSILNLDLTLGAFYPWTLDITGPRFCGIFLTPTLNSINNPFNTSIKDNFIKYNVASVVGGVYKFTFALFRDYNFVDWQSYNGVGYDYLSYLESGYELLEDAMRNKEITYLFCYFRQTEENYVLNGAVYEPDNPSSCLMQVKWDWASSEVSNKYSTKAEAYKIELPVVDPTNLVIDTGFPVVSSKNKVRGHGRAIQFRFESNGIGKDFDLLGWSVPYSGNTAP